MLSHEEQQKILGAILKQENNLYCAECGGKSPCWASLDFGVFVCLNCSGAHRALGPSVTRVKSTRLDTWNKDWVNCVQVGNKVLNEYWEHDMQEADKRVKPNENSSVDFIIRFVKDKYVRKLYVNPNQSLEEVIKKQKSRSPVINKKSVAREEGGRNPRMSLGKMHKAQTIVGDMPSSKQIERVKADFSFFDEMMVTKKEPKPASNHNLINLEEQRPKSSIKKATSFLDFDMMEAPKPKEDKQKYNKQQFMSMGGINPNKPKPKNNIDFDLFHHNAEKKVPNNANLLNFQNNQNKNTKFKNNVQFSQYGFDQINRQPQYNKNNFATAGGGFNVNAVQNGQVGSAKVQGNGQQGKNMMNFGNTWGGRDGFPFTPQSNKAQGSFQSKQQNNAAKISLQPTINFDKMQKGGIKVESGPRSWVDEWK